MADINNEEITQRLYRPVERTTFFFEKSIARYIGPFFTEHREEVHHLGGNDISIRYHVGNASVEMFLRKKHNVISIAGRPKDIDDAKSKLEEITKNKLKEIKDI